MTEVAQPEQVTTAPAPATAQVGDEAPEIQPIDAKAAGEAAAPAPAQLAEPVGTVDSDDAQDGKAPTTPGDVTQETSEQVETGDASDKSLAEKPAVADAGDAPEVATQVDAKDCAPATVVDAPAAVVVPSESATNGTSTEADQPGVSSSSAAVTGEKRKAEEPIASNGEIPDEKRVKSEDKPAADAATNGAAAPTKKAGRHKKDTKTEEKDAAAPVGRTLRKTRSQGPA